MRFSSVPRCPMIILLTDFGTSEYVGVMKGVILNHAPHTTIVDLYHGIQPQCIKQGAWLLYKNYSFFLTGSIFLCIVDPGVGTKRHAVAIQTKNYFFVGPDNGLLYPAAQQDGIQNVVALSTAGASKTFHGRDVFAKAAALLEKGIPLQQLGKTTLLKEKLYFHVHDREGEVVHIDRFGNIITTLPSLHTKKYTVVVKNKQLVLPYYNTYQEAGIGELFLIEGSGKTLEISMQGKAAVAKLKLKIGEKIEVH